MKERLVCDATYDSFQAQLSSCRLRSISRKGLTLGLFNLEGLSQVVHHWSIMLLEEKGPHSEIVEHHWPLVQCDHAHQSTFLPIVWKKSIGIYLC